MRIRGRTILAAMAACLFLLLFTAETYPASHAEAGRAYAVARERLAELKKAPRKRKYRSYWIDCIRTFEAVESRYPSTPQAADACFDGASTYLDLYRFSRTSKYAFQAAKEFSRCRASYPHHARAPEALYHVAAVAKSVKKDPAGVTETYRELAKEYPSSPWTEKARRLAGIRSASRNGATKRSRREPEIKNPPVAEIEAPKGPPGTVQNVRYWSGGNYTRIVIDQDKPLKFDAFQLKKPDRLVFDIQHSRVSDSVDRDPLPVHDGILKQVRTSQYDPQTVRVVLDLASLKSYLAFPLHDPERLVIDVTGDQSGDDEASADAPSTPAGEHSVSVPSSSPDVGQQPVSPPVATGKDEKLSLARQLGLKIKTIAIDAGHGGHDPGAIGRGGLKEKNVTLDIARRLSTLVKDRLGCRVVMTRDDDTFIPLDERPAIAKTKGADLFVSIHVNANRRRRARGIETYLFGIRPSDRDAMATAAYENATSTKTLGQLDTELAKILNGLSKQNKEEESVELANYVQRSLVSTMRPVKGRIVNLGVKRAFFYVLVNTNMPSILAEVGFISNPQEEKLLRKESYRQKIAEALFEGVKKFVESRGQQVAGL